MCLLNVDVGRNSHKQLVSGITPLVSWITVSSPYQNATGTQAAADMQIPKANHSSSENWDEIKDSLLVSGALRREKIRKSLPESCPATLGSHMPQLFITLLCLSTWNTGIPQIPAQSNCCSIQPNQWNPPQSRFMLSFGSSKHQILKPDFSVGCWWYPLTGKQIQVPSWEESFL